MTQWTFLRRLTATSTRQGCQGWLTEMRVIFSLAPPSNTKYSTEIPCTMYYICTHVLSPPPLLYVYRIVLCVFQMSYEISKICTCEIMDEKNPQRTVFPVIRVGKDGKFKNMDFETTLMTASELYGFFILNL